MQNLFNLTALFLILTTVLTAQDYSISNLNLQHLLDQDGSIVRMDHYRVEIRSANKMTIEHQRAVTYLKNPGGDLSPVLYYNELSDIKGFEVNIYNASGDLVHKYKKRDIIDEACLTQSIYTDCRIKYFEIGKFEFPLTIEYSYKKRYKGIMSFPAWQVQEFDQSVQHARCEIVLDDDLDLFFRFENSNVEPVITHSRNVKEYRWIIKDLPAVEKEVYTPDKYNILPSLQYGTSKFEVEQFEGSYENWASFGHFLQQFYNEAQNLPAETKEKVREITANTSSNREKIQLLYDYLQNTTRYVSVQIGLGGWKTYDAKYVSDNDFGDCKALSNYLGSLLALVDIPSHPVIIQRNDNPYRLTNDFVFNRFNHAILYIPEEDIFVECTASSGPEGYIGASNENRKALLVNGANSKLISTPNTACRENLRLSHSQINIQTNQASSITSTEEYFHHRQDILRAKYEYFDRKAFEKNFRSGFPVTISSLDSLQIILENDTPKALLSYKLTSKEFSSQVGQRIFLNLNPLYRTSISLPEDEERSSAIVINTYGLDSNVLLYNIPENYELESMPASPIIIESDWGRYSISFEFTSPDTLRVERVFLFQDVNESAEKYEELKSFYDSVKQTDSSTKIVLVQK